MKTPRLVTLLAAKIAIAEKLSTPEHPVFITDVEMFRGEKVYRKTDDSEKASSDSQYMPIPDDGFIFQIRRK